MFRTGEQSVAFDQQTALYGAVSRRSVVLGGASALAVGVLTTTGLKGAMAQDSSATPGADEEGDASGIAALRAKLDEYGFLWSATSPATHSGDTFTLTATNPGSTAVKLLTFTLLMDHRNHEHQVVINEEVELAAGALHDFTATNDYGTANHFSTRIASTAADATALTLTATVTTTDGVESASFNERAFMIDSREDLQTQREERRAARKEARSGRQRPGLCHRGMDRGGNDATSEADATADL